MSTQNIHIRLAADADRAGLLFLAPRLAEGVAPWRNPKEALAAGRRWLDDSLAAMAKGDGAVFVAADGDGDGVVGVISIRPALHFTGERDGYIGELAVAGHQSRRGTGRALIDAADAWARDHGLANLTLHTGAFNADARAFYAALGFAEEEVRLTRPVAPGVSTGATEPQSPKGWPLPQR
jgi:GNAT superfamily N-acetyltransferase